MSADHFPADHFVESLRCEPVPDRQTIRRTLAGRASWLEKKLRSRMVSGEPCGHYLDELASLVTVVEIAEAAWAHEDAVESCGDDP